MKFALAGATGYLGQYIAKELNSKNIEPSILTRRWDSSLSEQIKTQNVFQVDFQNSETLKKKLYDIDIVISTLGITRQKDNLTYMNIDYQANYNLLEEAKKSGVKKFVYVSALNGDKLKHTKIFQAKEKFVEALKNSGLEYIIIRPNGFFSDMKDFLNMAKKGRIYLFGKGQKKLNPIDGTDLANFIIKSVYEQKNIEIEVGGPKLYTHKEIAELAFKVLKKEVKITYIPDVFRKLALKLLPLCGDSKTYGPIEFFLSALGIDMVAPKFGKNDLENFYKKQQEE